MSVVIRRVCPFSVNALYGVASDIAAYPQFLPNCTATRVRSRKDGDLLVDNVFRWGALPLNFQTRATFDPPHGIRVRAVDTLVLEFALGWRFEETDAGTEVTFEMALKLPSKFLQNMAEDSIARQAEAIADAFIARTALLQVAATEQGEPTDGGEHA